MSELDDHCLLAEFVRDRSETAFTELVRRYAGLVYSTAFRYCSNPHHAEEITQAVFVMLARKAGTLSPRVVVSGWLYQTARLTAANFVKGEMRRRRREQEAVMQSNLLETGLTDWGKIAPLLDDAMGALGETDRNAVLLRYFENRTSSEIGVALRMNEETARKRVNRALEKLRQLFVKRGVTVSGAALSDAITANSVQPISAFMVKTISAVAAAKGAAASISTLTLIKGALNIMAWTKVKTAIVVGVAILLATGTTTVVVKKINPPSVDESLWSVDSDNITKAPPVLIIRPARYPNRVGSVDDGNKVIGLNMPISALFFRAYGPNLSAARMILPPSVARHHYDLMLTLPSHAMESLREKLKTQLGLVARRKIVETNVLCLKVKDAAVFESSISKAGSPVGYMTSDVSFARLIVTNQPVSFLATQLESFLQIPTIDQTGATGNFDINLKWSRNDPRQDSLKNALASQLGLELVPTNMPIEMLVVEKAN